MESAAAWQCQGVNNVQRLRERFWFIPAVLCLAAFALAEGLVALDERLGGLDVPGWAGTLLYRVGASGSRDVLGAIASSSLAVAGTTFSITIAVLALTSSTYGPRLVRNFMADRGNQAVLGVFVATFLYSLLVLRSIRVIGDAGEDAFVPHLAVNAAVLLAVADVAVLIYFIHHISDSIQITTLTGRVRDELLATIERLYPLAGDHDGVRRRGPGGAPDEGAGDLPRPEGGAPVAAHRSGYLQSLDEDELVRLAREHDVAVVLNVRPGGYVLQDGVIAHVLPADRADDGLADGVRATLHISDARTPYQDPEFAVQQLTEMAVRALSPGTNDPYTAVNALDDLSSALSALAARVPPARARVDEEGRLRVHAPRVGVEELVVPVIDGMRWYAASAPSVMHATLDLVERVGVRSASGAVRTRLLTHVGLLEDAFTGAGHHAHDVQAFAEHARSVRARLLSA